MDKNDLFNDVPNNKKALCMSKYLLMTAAVLPSFTFPILNVLDTVGTQ